MKKLSRTPAFMRHIPNRSWAALGLVLVTALSAVLLGVSAVLASEASSPMRQVLEDDLFLFGEDQVVSGTVKGNVFAFGRGVRLEGDVEGSLFVLSDQLSLEGRVAGSVYAAAVTLRQTAGSEVGQNLFAAAVNLATERGAVVGRDLRVIAVSANLRGEVGRNTQARIGLLELFRALRRGVTGGITSLPLPGHTQGVSPPPAAWARAAAAGLLGVVLERSLPVAAPPQAQPAEAQAQSPWMDALKALLVLILVGGAALWLFPVSFERVVDQVRQRPLASAGAGAVVLVNGFLMPVLITILVGSAFYGLIFLTVPDLAWMVFGVGFGVSVTAFALFLIATTYLSKAVVAAMVGGLILRRFLPRFGKARVLHLLLGLLIYIALVSIPYLGFTVGLLVTITGLGAMWLGRKPEPAVVEMESV